MRVSPSEFRIDTVSRNDLSICFVLVDPRFSQVSKSFLLSRSVRGSAHANTSVDRLRISVTSSEFARNHSALNRMFMPVTHRGRPKGLPRFLDEPDFFQR